LDSIPKSALKIFTLLHFILEFLRKVKAFFVQAIINFFATAAKPRSNSLEKKGRIVVAEPEGFIVKGRERLLKEGELERAMR
jgi:hypothetical protein